LFIGQGHLPTQDQGQGKTGTGMFNLFIIKTFLRNFVKKVESCIS